MGFAVPALSVSCARCRARCRKVTGGADLGGVQEESTTRARWIFSKWRRGRARTSVIQFGIRPWGLSASHPSFSSSTAPLQQDMSSAGTTLLTLYTEGLVRCTSMPADAAGWLTSRRASRTSFELIRITNRYLQVTCIQLCLLCSAETSFKTIIFMPNWFCL